MTSGIIIRRVNDPDRFPCFFCGQEAKLEVEHAPGHPLEGTLTEICIDCARKLGHASIGNRTWKPSKT